MRCRAATNSWRTASASAGGCSASVGAQAKANIALKSIFRQVDMSTLWWLNALPMKSKVVAILETRTGAHLAELVARRGGVPMLAPALEEVPDVDPQAVLTMLERWRIDPFKICIFQTGVGTRALFSATDAANLTLKLKELLAASMIVVRGPKPVGELNARGIRIDIRAASPFTSETVLAAIAGVSVEGARVVVQRYGEANRKLCAALTARGASVQEIATYRW